MATIQDVWRTIGTATRVLNLEIKKEIVRQNAVDTTRMRNVSKIVNMKWDENKDQITLEIDSTFYYKFVDEKKARKWKNGRMPRNITKAFMQREKVLDQLEKVAVMTFEYRIDQQFR